MAERVRVVVHEAEIQRLLRGPGSPVTRDLLRRGHRVEAAAKQFVGVDTGRLRSSINTQLAIRGSSVAVRVGTNVAYARYHHDGVGIFGSGRPIRPKRPGGFLVFKPKGSRTVVFAKQVRGYKGTKFLERALPASRVA